MRETQSYRESMRHSIPAYVYLALLPQHWAHYAKVDSIFTLYNTEQVMKRQFKRKIT